MKKTAFALVAAFMLLPLCSVAQDGADEGNRFTVELNDVGASTSYLWRGQELGGLNLQGDLSCNLVLGDFSASLGTWFIHSFQESIYGPFMGNGYQEWDLYVSAAYKGLALTVTDYMAAPYFKNSINGEGHALDATLAYYISDDLPLTFSWSTIFAGGDDVEEQPEGSMNHRFYSSYFETSYDFAFGDFPVDFTASVGLVPWTSPYIDDVEGTHVAWLGLCAGYKVPLGSRFTLPLSLTAGVNPTDASFLWSFAIGF